VKAASACAQIVAIDEDSAAIFAERFESGKLSFSDDVLPGKASLVINRNLVSY